MIRFVFYKNCSGYTTENGLKRDKVDVGAHLGKHYRSLSGKVIVAVAGRHY